MEEDRENLGSSNRTPEPPKDYIISLKKEEYQGKVMELEKNKGLLSKKYYLNY